MAGVWSKFTGYLSVMPANKSLGQHWLHDQSILSAIADEAEIAPNDTVLEIGPGLGTLTSELLRRAHAVVAVEYDAELARKLPGQFPGKNLTVKNADILHFPLDTLPHDYIVCANVPYYITSKIIQRLAESTNPPKTAALLVQKEVAERVAAPPGAMSMLSVATQVYFAARPGINVSRDYFTPPPEVDSQTIILTRHTEPLVSPAERGDFFRTVRAGFSERRKKLRSSLAGSLHLPKSRVDDILHQAGIAPDARAQELSIDEWKTLSREITITL